MKLPLVLLSVFLVFNTLYAQENAYQRTMLRTIESLHKAAEKQEFLSCASQFERIATAEENRWLPYYYGAYSLILLSFDESEGTEKDLILDRAQDMLDRALLLEPGESELHALQAFLYPSRILVDPMNRGMIYMEKIFASLDQAKTLNPENPRPWFLEGVNKLNLPPAFGGGAEVARPILLEAEAKFQAFSHEDPLWPDWGADANRAELEKLQKIEDK